MRIEARAAKDMDMQVEESLPPAFARIDDGAETVFQALLFSQLRRLQKHFAQQG